MVVGRELGPKAHDFAVGVMRDNEVSFPGVDMYILYAIVCFGQRY